MRIDLQALAAALESALDRGDADALARRAEEAHPADLAAAAEGLDGERRLALFERLPAALAGPALAELEDLSSRHVANDLGGERVAELLGELSPARAIDVLEHLSDERQRRVVASLPEALARQVAPRLAYPVDSAGRIMTVEVATVAASARAGDATDELRARGAGGAVAAIFAVDAERRVVGAVAPLRLLLAGPDEAIADLVDRAIPSVAPERDQEEAAELATRYDLAALPVTDADGRLLGAISFDDVYDVIEEEDVEDLSYAAGTGMDAPTEPAARRAIRARLPWLLVGLAGGIASATVMSRFESALAEAVSLAFFVPVVLGLAGGAAVQSSSLAVRGLATGSIRLGRLPRLAWRELRVSLGMAVALGVLLGVAAYALTGGDAAVAGVLAVVLLSVLVTATVTGTLIPVLLERLGADPAVAMGPFVTTLSDILAISIYLGLASALLPRMS